MIDNQTIIPMPRVPVFSQVEMQVVSWCNRTCLFCPSGTFPAPKEVMSREVAQRIAGELNRIGFSGTIGLHMMCEPLLHKDFRELLRLFRSRAMHSYIRIDTNGDVIKHARHIHELFEAGLNEIVINCYDSQQQFDRFNENLLELEQRYPHVWYWNKWLYNPKGERHVWRLVRLRAFFETGYTLRNWAGQVPNSHKEEIQFPLQMECDRVVDRLHVNYLGQVVLCNNDWKFEVVAGDLMKDDILAVWASPVLEEYRRHLSNRDRNMPLCRGCDNGYPRVHMPGFPPADRWAKIRHLLALASRLPSIAIKHCLGKRQRLF